MDKFKKLFTLLLLVVAVGFMTSCSEDDPDETNPTATITVTAAPQNGTVFRPSDSYNISFDAVDPDKRMQDIVATINGNPVTPSSGTLTLNSSERDGFSKNLTFSLSGLSGDVSMKLSVVDNNGAEIVSTSQNITVWNPATWTAKLLGAQSASQGSYLKNDGTVLTTTLAQGEAAAVLFSYLAYGSPTANPTMASYEERGNLLTNLTVPTNAAKCYFVKNNDLTSLSGQIKGGFSVSATSPQSITLAVGDFVEFYFPNDSKYGVFEVKNINTGSNGLDGAITIDVAY